MSQEAASPVELSLRAACLLVLVLQVRVVILGQDPYINAGEAMGLSFSVPPGMCVCAVRLRLTLDQQTCITAAPSAAQAAGSRQCHV